MTWPIGATNKFCIFAQHEKHTTGSVIGEGPTAASISSMRGRNSVAKSATGLLNKQVNSLFSLVWSLRVMKLPVQSEGFERCPAGNHLAICYEVIDLGTQQYQFEGESGTRHQIWIGWETPHETMEDGRPYVIGRRYTLSSHERSRLRKDLESWRGKAFSDDEFGSFEISDVIGKGCFLNVVHIEKNGKTYANIEAVAALPKGTETPPLRNSAIRLDLTAEDFNQSAFDSLSDRMRETIEASPEYAAICGRAPSPESYEPEDENTAAF